MSALAYDRAPRAITTGEAADIAAGEYGCRRGDRGWIILHRGSDGGWHYADRAANRAAAEDSCAERRRALVARIMAGACTATIFFDRARDRFYCA